MRWRRRREQGQGRPDGEASTSDEELAVVAHQLALACDDVSLGEAQEVMSRTEKKWPTLIFGMSLIVEKQFRRTGALRDLDQAIAGLRAISGTAHDDTVATFASALGRMLHERFEVTGDLSVLDEAIRCGRRGVEAVPPEHSSLPDRLNNLVGSLYSNYRATGDVASLDEAVDGTRRALSVCPRDREDRAALAANLQMLTLEQDRVRGTPSRAPGVAEPADTVDALRDAVAALPPEDPRRAEYMARLVELLGRPPR